MESDFSMGMLAIDWVVWEGHSEGLTFLLRLAARKGPNIWEYGRRNSKGKGCEVGISLVSSGNWKKAQSSWSRWAGVGGGENGEMAKAGLGWEWGLRSSRACGLEWGGGTLFQKQWEGTEGFKKGSDVICFLFFKKITLAPVASEF